jgi:hypothetical protein
MLVSEELLKGPGRHLGLRNVIELPCLVIWELSLRRGVWLEGAKLKLFEFSLRLGGTLRLVFPLKVPIFILIQSLMNGLML